MNENPGRSPDQIQAKLKNLQQSPDQQQAAGGTPRDIEITVASQREAFDLNACRALLQENGIPSRFVGRGFNQTVVVSRDDSGRAIDVIAAHRERLVRANPLTSADYVVGIVAWSLGCGLLLPGIGFWFLMKSEVAANVYVFAVPVLFGSAMVFGGFLGYFRCRAVANRRR